MNELSQKILAILASEMSEITSRSIINHYTGKIGKTPATLNTTDLPKFSKAVLESVFLFSDSKKAKRIFSEIVALNSK